MTPEMYKTGTGCVTGYEDFHLQNKWQSLGFGYLSCYVEDANQASNAVRSGKNISSHRHLALTISTYFASTMIGKLNLQFTLETAFVHLWLPLTLLMSHYPY